MLMIVIMHLCPWDADVINEKINYGTVALGTEYAQFVLLQSLVPWFYYVRVRNLKRQHQSHACSTVVVCDNISKILIAIDWVLFKLMLPLLHRYATCYVFISTQ